MKDWINKDVAGAIFWLIVIFVAGLVLVTVSGCTVAPEYRPAIEAGMAIELDGDKPVVGRDPVGVARVRQPLYVHQSGFELFGEYLHLSSIPDVKDKNTVDQLGILFKVPLGRPGPSLDPQITDEPPSSSKCVP